MLLHLERDPDEYYPFLLPRHGGIMVEYPYPCSGPVWNKHNCGIFAAVDHLPCWDFILVVDLGHEAGADAAEEGW